MISQNFNFFLNKIIIFFAIKIDIFIMKINKLENGIPNY